MEFVPFGEGEMFEISADTMTYQSTLVNLVEVGVVRSKFMGIYADKRFQKYDDNYKPNSKIKFGDLNKPSLSGNWESK